MNIVLFLPVEEASVYGHAVERTALSSFWISSGLAGRKCSRHGTGWQG